MIGQRQGFIPVLVHVHSSLVPPQKTPLYSNNLKQRWYLVISISSQWSFMFCQTCSSPTHLLHLTRIHHQSLQVASSTAGRLLPTPRTLELPGENPEPDFDGGDVWCSRITGNHCWAPETNKQSHLKINGSKFGVFFRLHVGFGGE